MTNRTCDCASWIIRNRNSPYAKIPLHLKHYKSMSYSDRIERIAKRIARAKAYLFPDEARKMFGLLKDKYAWSNCNSLEERSGLFHVGLIGQRQSINLVRINGCLKSFHNILSAVEQLRKRDKNMETTGELRKTLAKCLIDAMEGRLSGDAMRGVIGCANQINASLAVEIKGRAQLAREGVSAGAMGDMKLDK